MKGLGRPISSFLKGRNFAAGAAQTQATLNKQEIQISKLANGAVVASVDNNSPVSRVAILFNGGSRFEEGHNLGVTHALRNASYLSGKNASSFAIVKHIQQCGGNVTTRTTRDHMIYSLECLPSGLDDIFKYFACAAHSPSYMPHEVKTLVDKHKLDLGVLQQEHEVQLVEALHSVAYRCGLKNSLYMPEYMVGSHDGLVMSQFVQKHCTSSNMTVVGVGVEHDRLEQHVAGIDMEQGTTVAEPKAMYHGGELRINSKNEFVHAAVVTEGAGAYSEDFIPVAVLQHVMGSGQYTKYSSQIASSKVSKAVAGATQNPFAATCMNSSLRDTGLFGFHVVAYAGDMTQVLQSIVKTFGDATKGGITDDDVKRAKAQLKSALLMKAETYDGTFKDMCDQIMISGKTRTAEELCDAVDAVTLSQVQSIAKKIINSKPSMVAIGDLCETPYLDQLL